MKATKGIEPVELVERGVLALCKELGATDARRFIALTHPPKRDESVRKHRKWQSALSADVFFKEMKDAHTRGGKKKS